MNSVSNTLRRSSSSTDSDTVTPKETTEPPSSTMIFEGLMDDLDKLEAEIFSSEVKVAPSPNQNSQRRPSSSTFENIETEIQAEPDILNSPRVGLTPVVRKPREGKVLTFFASRNANQSAVRQGLSPARQEVKPLALESSSDNQTVSEVTSPRIGPWPVKSPASESGGNQIVPETSPGRGSKFNVHRKEKDKTNQSENTRHDLGGSVGSNEHQEDESKNKKTPLTRLSKIVTHVRRGSEKDKRNTLSDQKVSPKSPKKPAEPNPNQPSPNSEKLVSLTDQKLIDFFTLQTAEFDAHKASWASITAAAIEEPGKKYNALVQVFVSATQWVSDAIKEVPSKDVTMESLKKEQFANLLKGMKALFKILFSPQTAKDLSLTSVELRPIILKGSVTSVFFLEIIGPVFAKVIEQANASKSQDALTKEIAVMTFFQQVLQEFVKDPEFANDPQKKSILGLNKERTGMLNTVLDEFKPACKAFPIASDILLSACMDAARNKYGAEIMPLLKPLIEQAKIDNPDQWIKHLVEALASKDDENNEGLRHIHKRNFPLCNSAAIGLSEDQAYAAMNDVMWLTDAISRHLTPAGTKVASNPSK